MNFLRVIKMSLAFLLAMTIANHLQLSYSASAGIVAILTIQNMKKETLKIGFKRLISFIISLLWGLIIFHIFGYSVLSFTLFLIFFISFSYYFHLEDGITMNAVIATHYLIEQSMSINWIINETSLFMIGVTIGILMNLYMPSYRQQIEESLYQIDESMRDIIKMIADCLIDQCPFRSVEKMIDDVHQHMFTMIEQTTEQMNNQLFHDTQYELDYLYIRKQQLSILKDIYHLLHSINWQSQQAHMISQYLYSICYAYHKDNDVKELSDQLQQLEHYFETIELPQTRLEFENRAILFTILTYLQKFLKLKNEFAVKTKTY